jgi:hypothetical protein
MQYSSLYRNVMTQSAREVKRLPMLLKNGVCIDDCAQVLIDASAEAAAPNHDARRRRKSWLDGRLPAGRCPSQRTRDQAYLNNQNHNIQWRDVQAAVHKS